jgi:hypothetical protein
MAAVPQYFSGNWDANQTKFIAGADSIHDFKSVRMDPSYFGTVSGQLVAALNNLFPAQQQAGDYSSWLSTSTGRGVTSASDVEDQTVDFYEAQYSIPLKTTDKIIITYRDVIDIIKAYTDGTRQQGLGPEPKINIAIYRTNLEFNEGDILEIDLADGEDWDLNYTKTEKMYIGIFLLNFFFMPIDDTEGAVILNSSTATYISFDAGSSMPDKIFGTLDQVINLVTPLNIADSATTFKHLGGQRNYYYFPFEADANTWDYESNIFTRGNVGISVSKSAAIYDSNSRFDFSLDIRYTQVGGQPAVRRALFDSDHTSGPGVDYLSQIIHFRDPASVTIPNKTLDISTFYKPHIFGNTPQGLMNEAMLLFDIKRSGDAEQCRATKNANVKEGTVTLGRSILSTIDRLCSLQSRMMESNTIYHYSTKMILYRFQTNLTPEQLLEKAVAMKEAYKVKLRSAIDCLINFIEVSSSIKTAIRAFQERMYELYPTAQFTLPRPIERVTSLVTQLAKIQLTETDKLLSYVLEPDQVPQVATEVVAAADQEEMAADPEEMAAELEVVAAADPQQMAADPEVVAATRVLDADDNNLDKSVVDIRIAAIKDEIVRINMRLNGDFFQRLTTIFKRSINASNYQSCIDTLSKDFVTQKGGVYTFKKCEVLQYNYDTLKTLYSGFSLILSLDPEKRNFSLLNIPNALEQSGFYRDIKAFISMVEFDVDVDTLVVDAVITIDTYERYNHLQKTCILLLSILKYRFPLDYKEKSYIVGNSGFKAFCEQCVAKILSFQFPPPALALGGGKRVKQDDVTNPQGNVPESEGDGYQEAVTEITEDDKSETIEDYELIAFTNFTREMTNNTEEFFKKIETLHQFQDITTILSEYEDADIFKDYLRSNPPVVEGIDMGDATTGIHNAVDDNIHDAAYMDEVVDSHTRHQGGPDTNLSDIDKAFEDVLERIKIALMNYEFMLDPIYDIRSDLCVRRYGYICLIVACIDYPFTKEQYDEIIVLHKQRQLRSGVLPDIVNTVLDSANFTDKTRVCASEIDPSVAIEMLFYFIVSFKEPRESAASAQSAFASAASAKQAWGENTLEHFPQTPPKQQDPCPDITSFFSEADEFHLSKNKNILIVLLLFYIINNLFNLRSKATFIHDESLYDGRFDYHDDGNGGVYYHDDGEVDDDGDDNYGVVDYQEYGNGDDNDPHNDDESGYEPQHYPFGYYDMFDIPEDFMDDILKLYASSISSEENIKRHEVSKRNLSTYIDLDNLLVRFLIAINFMKKNNSKGFQRFVNSCTNISTKLSRQLSTGKEKNVSGKKREHIGGKSKTKKYTKKYNKTRKHFKKHTKSKHTIKYKSKNKKTKKHIKKTNKKSKNNKTKSNKKPKNRRTKKRVFTK